MEEQTLTNLTNGIYKVSLSAFHRMRGNAETYTLHNENADWSVVYLYAGDYQMPLPSVMSEYATEAYTEGWNPNFLVDEKNYPNSMDAAGQAFNSGKYKLEFYTLVTDGTLKIGIKDPGKNNNYNWICYRDLKVEFLNDFTGDYSDLESAITTAEGKTLGFETGEYAPYNNVAALTALANANALNTSRNATSQDAIDAVTTALTGAIWTDNTAEVNAVYNGDFALSENDGAMTGWVTDHSAGLGGSYHARAFVLKDGDPNYDKLAVFGQGNGKHSCAYFRFDGTNSTKTTLYTYGTTDGYTMPLKTNTIYKLTANVGGWGQNTKNFQIAVVNSSNENIVAQILETPSTRVNDGGSVIDYEMYFVVSTNGNYKLVFSNASTDADNAVVVSNIELFSTDALVFADGVVPTYAPGKYPAVKVTRSMVAGRWYTAVYPFEVSGTIATLSSYVASTGTLGFTTSSSSEANKPFLMRNSSDVTEINLNNVEVAAVPADPVAVIANEASLIGTYTTMNVTNTDTYKYYVLSSNNICPVSTDTDNPTYATPYRAFIQIEQPGSSARALTFVVDGEQTAIEGVTAAPATNGEVYNLNGQRVNAPVKGLYIVNGKKVIMK